MAGLGAAIPPNTDALGQLLSEYSKRVYSSQLQHLKVDSILEFFADINFTFFFWSIKMCEG